MQHVNTEILKENQNLRNELKKLTSITETWLNSSNKVNQCISEQIPTQKKKILGINQLTKDTSSSRPKDLVFIKSSADNLNVSITSSNKTRLSEAKDFTLPNHDTGKVSPDESQRKTTDLPVVVSESLTTDYNSVDESSVCSIPHPPLEKLAGAKPVSGPKTIKSILKSESTFKAGTLKGAIISEPSTAPAKDNISTSVSKTNSAPTSNLKNVKMEDDPLLAIVMKELNEIKLQISKNKYISITLAKVNLPQDPDLQGQQYLFLSTYIVGIMIINLMIVYTIPHNPQHVTKSYETCGSNGHTTIDHNDIERFKKREALQAKKAETFKISRTESSSALRSKTPTKRLMRKERYQANPKESHLIAVKISRKCTSKYLSVARRQICVLKYKKVAICLFAESADIFTSPLDEPTFKRLIVELDTMVEDSPTQVKTKEPNKILVEGESMEEYKAMETKAPENLRTEPDIWKLYTDEASNKHGSGAGLILIDPDGAEYSYALRLNFANSNNDAEYEALLAGLRIATKIKVEKMHAFIDSKLVASQVEGSYEAKGEKTKKYKEKTLEMIRSVNNFQISHIPREENRKADALSKLAAVQCEGLTKGVLIEELNERSVDTAEVNAIIEEATRTWMTPIQEYIEKKILPEDATKARTIREKARNDTIEE
ncbi:retrovirus-related pol polyprotein from transposon TNT 1-94 [Tanacetum coccineum]